MATINLTNQFLNENKRYSETVVMTVPAMLQEGGGRANSAPTYIQGSDALTAAIIEEDTIIVGTYLIIDEAFPAGAEINVDIAGTQYFVAVDGTSVGATKSTQVDVYLKNPQTVTVSITGVTGDITTGVARVVFETIHPSLKNGQYAN